MSKLVIISHTKHYYSQNREIVGWEPTIREINYISKLFDSIYHVAPLYSGNAHQANASYNKNITYFPIKPAGGDGILKKMEIIFFMPFNLWHIIKVINKSDYIHFRAPTNLGLYVLPLLLLYKNKKKWIKYAGNWSEINPPISYRFQRWWLRKNILKSKVTINGNWKKQQSHLLSFENPCLTEVELENSKISAKQKDYSGKLNLCFVGRLEPAKGALIILELLQNLEDVDWVDTFYIVGDGPSRKILEEQKSNLKIKVSLPGWLSRDQLNEIYTNCHLIILPSYASEGFPKVLAEAASYGCVPIVSNLSSISQYIKNNISGVLIDDLTQTNIKSVLSKLSNKREKLMSMASAALKWVSLFTYSRYVFRIEKEIINE